MESLRENSKICKFYEGKHVMVTGCTGFLGKLTIEKLLRTCKPAKIYLIIRTKKTKGPIERLNELIRSPVFDRVKSEDPGFMSRLVIVPGDVSSPNLGVSQEDYEVLVQKVEVVFHVAANVKFDEPIRLATQVNVLGSKNVLELCKKMTKLESVVHVSTAYSHCPNHEIKEQFYETPFSSNKLIQLTESYPQKFIDEITPNILGKWVNSYVFTKAVAEEAVRENGKDLPIAIFRPGIILSTRSEPMPNWVEQPYGALGSVLGSAVGLMHVFRFGENERGEFVPADMTVNCILAVGHKTAISRQQDGIPIYNFTSHPKNPATWGDYFRYMMKRGQEIPSSQTFWYYAIIKTRSRFIFSLFFFLFHILPAAIVDLGLVALHKKPRALELFKKIHRSLDLVGHFTLNSWNISIDNTIDLWRSLTDEDKILFDFDMETLDYPSYLSGVVDGVMAYILKEDENNLIYRKRRYFLLSVLHHVLKYLTYLGLLWCAWYITVSLNIPERISSLGINKNAVS